MIVIKQEQTQTLTVLSLVEQFNRTLITTLGCMADNYQSDWDYRLNLWHIRTKHASTGYTSNLLVFSEEIRLTVDLQYGILDEPKDEACKTLSSLYAGWKIHSIVLTILSVKPQGRLPRGIGTATAKVTSVGPL